MKGDDVMKFLKKLKNPSDITEMYDQFDDFLTEDKWILAGIPIFFLILILIAPVFALRTIAATLLMIIILTKYLHNDYKKFREKACKHVYGKCRGTGIHDDERWDWDGNERDEDFVIKAFERCPNCNMRLDGLKCTSG